jgi:hypothetical protein
MDRIMSHLEHKRPGGLEPPGLRRVCDAADAQNRARNPSWSRRARLPSVGWP